MESKHKELHDKATDLYQTQHYNEAAKFYTKALDVLVPTGSNNDGSGNFNNGTETDDNRDTQISYLTSRVTCYLKLKQHEKVIDDCDKILILTDNKNCKALMRKTLALSKLGKFNDAHNVAKLWRKLEPENSQALKELNRLKKILDALQEEGADEDDAHSSLEEVEATVDGSNHTTFSKGNLAASQQTPTGNDVNVNKKRNSKPAKCIEFYYCSYCDVKCQTAVDLHLHCTSESHQAVIMSDDGRDWKHRPPPRGVTSEEYSLCDRFPKCRFGEQCTSAHSEDELSEWIERYKYRKMKMQRAKDRQLHGNSYAEQILEKWMTSTTPLNV
ncbi:uncharacterized protein LOC102808405, partial [Saccoglossus kowalevskii]|uniref:Rotamase n=1 Tax=Saccoglossus kowalevskii TaxID=10224 RepID=A0ABM0MWN9_SACKO